MGLDDKNIISIGEDVSDTTLELIDNLIEEESDLLSLYYGTAVDKSDAEELVGRIEEIYPGIEVELNYGGQPIYYYFLSIE